MTQRSERELDQEYEELLQELRVSMPGLQVLFAFLLILPFSDNFESVSAVERGVYFAAFLSAGIASPLLIGPSVMHRLRWRQHDKEGVLRISSRLAIAGAVFLALAIACSVYLVTSFVYATALAAVTTAVVAVITVSIWFVLPLVRARRDH
ncbi:MAG TPA: DUF6328 family protein [Actinomycetota bacterium]|nr:DUF6328 family protein [Actinomycetota bacterium]